MGEITAQLTDYGSWLRPQVMCFCVRLTSLSEIFPSRLMYLLQSPFVCTAYGPSQELLCSGLVLASRYVAFAVPWEGLLSSQKSVAVFDCSRLSGGHYKVIRRWLLPMLDLKVSRRDNAVGRGLVIPLTGPGAL